MSLTWEKIPGSPRFSVLQATESWVGPGNKATTSPFPGWVQLVSGLFRGLGGCPLWDLVVYTFGNDTVPVIVPVSVEIVFSSGIANWGYDIFSGLAMICGFDGILPQESVRHRILGRSLQQPLWCSVTHTVSPGFNTGKFLPPQWASKLSFCIFFARSSLATTALGSGILDYLCFWISGTVVRKRRLISNSAGLYPTSRGVER